MSSLILCKKKFALSFLPIRENIVLECIIIRFNFIGLYE